MPLFVNKNEQIIRSCRRILLKNKALIIGSTAVDIVIEVEALPRPQEDLNVVSHKISIGGCAHNVASMVKYLGCTLDFLTPVGKGIYGNLVKKRLGDMGISAIIGESDKENGCCYCFVEKDGDRTFMCNRGAEYVFEDRFFSGLNLEDYEYIYLCGLDFEGDSGEIILNFLENHKSTAMPKILFAPGPRIGYLPEQTILRLMKYGPILHMNREESSFLEKRFGSLETVAELTQNHIVVTLGEDGARVYIYAEQGVSKDEFQGIKVNGVGNTVGAGDGHAGAVLGGLLEGDSILEAVMNANKLAAKIVELDESTLM